MIPRKTRIKPSIDQAVMEWRVIFVQILNTIDDAQRNDQGSVNETAVETAALVAAEIWKGVDHGDNA